MEKPKTVIHFAALCILVSIIGIAKADDALTRKVTTKILCPGQNKSHSCTYGSRGSQINVAYSTAVGPRDTLHYLFTTYSVPAVLMAMTKNHAKLTVDWSKFISENSTGSFKNSITFDEGNTTAEYVSVLLFHRLLEYNDTDDKANINTVTNPNLWKAYNFEDYEWEDTRLSSNLSDNRISFVINKDQKNLTFHKHNGTSAGYIKLDFRVSGDGNFSSVLPHMHQTPNTTEFDVTINNVSTTFSAARFVVELTLLTSDSKDKMDLKSFSSLDDEHTPGQFEVFDWRTKGEGQSKGAYLQWKPVCYTESSRSLEASTKAQNYTLEEPDMKVIKGVRNLALAYFGDAFYEATDRPAMMATNISFGLSEDKFYVKTNYTTWSSTYGYGTPPADGISLMIIIIIAVGLGLPIVLIIIGGVSICLWKKRQRRLGYEDLSVNA